ncbi:hypothetical protein ACIPUD_11025 [Bradyrhizobium sp. CAR08]
MTIPGKNEPGQAALDASNLSRIRQAQSDAAAKNEENNTVKNRLRGVFAQTAQQGLHNEAGKLALKLVEGGDDAINEFCEMVRKCGAYVGYLGKVLSPQQFELFGMAGLGPTPEDERAKIEGRAAGFRLDGEPLSTETDSPYDIGSIKGQVWLRAFRDARGERDTVLSMPPPAPEGGEPASKGDGAEDGGA